MTVGNPLFTVVTPVYEPPLDVLGATIDSVRGQTWSDWEFVLVDDGSRSAAVLEVLRAAAAQDSRIRVVERDSNGGIAAASNAGIEAARGEFIALLDHDDVLAPEALAAMAAAVAAAPDVDYLYSDEDQIDPTGEHINAFRKPDWSPERLRHQMYTCHLSVLRTSLVREIGGFHEGFDGSQDHDLALRITERARRVVHVPQVLYHWRVVPGSTAGGVGAKPYAWDAGRRAVQAHLERIGVDAAVDLGPHPGVYRIRREVSNPPRVSLVIPTRGTSGTVWGKPRCFVVEALRSALAKTNLPDVEVVVVYDEDAVGSRVLGELREICGGRLVLVPHSGPFNFSAQCNRGFLAATGAVVVLLNDDVEAIAQGWLEELIAPLLQERDVGMTGAHLLFADGTVQHGGHRYAAQGWLHAFVGTAPGTVEDFGALDVNRETSGVTAACAAIRREVYEQVGGLTETLPCNFNDVDVSMKIRAAGYRIVWVSTSTLYHFESRSRAPGAAQWEVDRLIGRWGRPARDAYLPS